MTNYIPTEFYEQMRDGIIYTARQQNIARSLIPSRLISGGLGTQQYGFDSATEVSEAMLSFAFSDNAEDIIGRSRMHLPIPVLHKEFRIGRRDIASAQNGNYELNTATANSAAYRVTNLENNVVINGYAPDGSNYEVKGLYQSVGQTTAGADFGTAGSAIATVQAALTLFDADDIYGDFDLLLNPVQYNKLAVSVFGANKEGVAELPMVKELIGGNIYKVPFLTAGTGMMNAKPNSAFAELVITQDLSYESEILPKSKDLWGRVYEVLVPVIYEADAFCSLTSI